MSATLTLETPLVANTLKARAIAGEPVLGAMIFEFFTPGIARIVQNAGAEFVIFDMEHGGLSLAEFKQQAAYCRGLDIAPMVRVPRGDYDFLARALDVGAHGVMIPMVESVEQARAIAEATHYPPKGRRGAAFGFAHDDYTAGSPAEKMQAADARTLVIAQIETERGLADVDAIAAVPGIDVLWLGHFDMTNFLGVPGAFEHPTYVAAVERIVAAGRRHKKGLGFMASDQKWAEAYKRFGFNMFAAGTDQGLLMAGVQSIIDSLKSKT
jgi:2-dehydro-3-deoxyglucarate aldolase/4-hydroxy-2-oxoheptanedioate aldolase